MMAGTVFNLDNCSYVRIEGFDFSGFDGTRPIQCGAYVKHCEFVNNIRAADRIAVDLNPDVVVKAGPGVTAHGARSDDMAMVETGSVDRVFVSNFFEHVDRETILATLVEIRRVLRPDGKLLVLQPNIRYCAKDYWMFFDHVTPVDDRSLFETL